MSILDHLLHQLKVKVVSGPVLAWRYLSHHELAPYDFTKGHKTTATLSQDPVSFARIACYCISVKLCMIHQSTPDLYDRGDSLCSFVLVRLSHELATCLFIIPTEPVNQRHC